MREYRVQIELANGNWEHLVDTHGRPYTYKTLESAYKHGIKLAYKARIVYADIEWKEV